MTITNKADLIEAVCDGDLNARGSFLRDVTTVEQLEHYAYDVAKQEPQTFALLGSDQMRGDGNATQYSPSHGMPDCVGHDVAGTTGVDSVAGAARS